MGSNRKRTIGPQDDELDSAGCCGEPATKWRSLKHIGHAGVAAKAMAGHITWVEVERWEGEAQEVGIAGERGDVRQKSEPS